MALGLSEGWWFPLNSRKAHYMTEETGRTSSLCRRWMALRPAVALDLEPNDAKPSLDDCATCRRKLDKRNAVLAERRTK